MRQFIAGLALLFSISALSENMSITIYGEDFTLSADTVQGAGPLRGDVYSGNCYGKYRVKPLEGQLQIDFDNCNEYDLIIYLKISELEDIKAYKTVTAKYYRPYFEKNGQGTIKRTDTKNSRGRRR